MYQLEIIELKKEYGEIVSIKCLNGMLNFYNLTTGITKSNCGHFMATKSIEMKLKYFGTNKKILHNEDLIKLYLRKLTRTTSRKKQYNILKDMLLTLDYEEIENIFDILVAGDLNG